MKVNVKPEVITRVQKIAEVFGVTPEKLALDLIDTGISFYCRTDGKFVPRRADIYPLDETGHAANYTESGFVLSHATQIPFIPWPCYWVYFRDELTIVPANRVTKIYG